MDAYGREEWSWWCVVVCGGSSAQLIPKIPLRPVWRIEQRCRDAHGAASLEQTGVLFKVWLEAGHSWQLAANSRVGLCHLSAALDRRLPPKRKTPSCCCQQYNPSIHRLNTTTSGRCALLHAADHAPTTTACRSGTIGIGTDLTSGIANNTHKRASSLFFINILHPALRTYHSQEM